MSQLLNWQEHVILFLVVSGLVIFKFDYSLVVTASKIMEQNFYLVISVY